MYLEIGDSPILATDKKADGLHINTDKKYCYYLNCGTCALYQVIELENIKKIYVASYNCRAVYRPFVNKNVEIIFFNVNRNFNIQNLFELLDKEEDKCAVLVQGYFAKYNLDNIKVKLRSYKNVTIIEDITHTMLDNRVFIGADYYVGSVRKWAGTGEGGVVFTDAKISSIAENDNDIMSLYNHIAPLQLEYIKTREQSIKNKYRNLQENANEFFRTKYIQKIHNTALDLIKTIDYEYIKIKRRENFCYLKDRLKDFDFISLPITELNVNSVPLYLPIYVDKRDELQHFLFKYNIYLPILWPMYDKIADKIDDETKYIYDHILCMHIDQRYDKNDMDRIYNALVDYKDQILDK